MDNICQHESYYDRQPYLGKKKALTSGSISRVLLVCIYNKSGTLITHDVFYRLFQKYGQVQKILIFEKAKVWKTFVEMDSVPSAAEAKKCLNNQVIFPDGSRMNIFYSNLLSINFQNQNSGGIDYTAIQRNCQSSQQLTSTNLKSGNDIVSSDSCEILSQDFGHSFYSTNNTKMQINPKDSPIIEPVSLLNTSHHDSLDDNRQFCLDNEKFSNQKDLGLINDPPQEVDPGYKYLVSNLNQSLSKLNKILETVDDRSESNSPSNPRHIVKKKSIQQPLCRGLNYLPPSAETDSNNGPAISSNTTQFSSTSSSENTFSQPIHPILVTTQQQSITSSTTATIPLMATNSIIDNARATSPSACNTAPDQQPPSSEMQNWSNNLLLKQQQKQQQMTISTSSTTPQPCLKQNPTVSIPSPFNHDANQQQQDLKQQSPIDPSSQADFSNYVNPLFLIENQKSPVIYVRGLENPNLQISWLMELFLSFGNIHLIIFAREKHFALIEFTNQEFATQAKDYLNNQVFMGCTMKIFYSNYQSLEGRKVNQQCGEEKLEVSVVRHKFKKHAVALLNANVNFAQQQQMMQTQLHIQQQQQQQPPPQQYQQASQNGLQYSINPPSQTLHISNLKKEVCTNEAISHLFSPYGNIINVKFINKDECKYMCQIKFNSLEESFNALVKMQGREICGRKIQISFTRSKI